MKRISIVLGMVVWFCGAAVAGELRWVELTRGKVWARCILADDYVYVGLDKGFVASHDKGISWQDVPLNGKNKPVNFLFPDGLGKDILYAATDKGLWIGTNSGKSWRNIFKGKNNFEEKCTSLVAFGPAIYLGTRAGFFISLDSGRTWKKASGRLGNSNVFTVACNLKTPEIIYVACVDGVYKIEKQGEKISRMFAVEKGEDGQEQEEQNEDVDEDEQFSEVRYLSIDPEDARKIYLATAHGVYVSGDGGQDWRSLPEQGLLRREVNFVLTGKGGKLYAANKAAIFVFENESWKELSFGLAAERINFLAEDKQGLLYAATEKGVFKQEAAPVESVAQEGRLEIYTKGEPPINEVQNAAIKYAEVSPEKIIEWRKLAAAKAILPKLTAEVGRDVADLWHWEGGSTTKSSDDELRRGRDSVEWVAAVTWDLSELIWSTDQTSIDTRSRLTVQLRDDILDEVNKTYFERIRIKAEIDNLAIEDSRKRFEKELRLQELTASLDALTGGYFSNQIAINKKE